MQYVLHLSNENLLRLHEHAESNLPNEAAALIFGTISGNLIQTKRVELMMNESSSSIVSFNINPEEQYRLMVEAEERNEELVCIFHSHPAPPYPSSTDKQNMKLNPIVWLIASKETESWESRAFILIDDDVQEVELVLS